MSSGSDRSDIQLRTTLYEPNKFIASQDLVAGNYTLAGFLRKRGAINRVPVALRIFAWSQRFVVLHQGCLYTYKTEVDKKPAGSFSLYGYNTVYSAGEIPSSEAPWAFKISHTYPEFKTYYFSAASEQDMKEWIKQIKLEMMRANNKLKKRTCADGQSSDDDQRSLNEDEIECPIYEDTEELVMNKNMPQPRREEDSESDDDYVDHVPSLPPRPHLPVKPKTGAHQSELTKEFEKLLMKPKKPQPKPKPKIRERADGNSGPKVQTRPQDHTPPGRQPSILSPTMPVVKAPELPKPTPQKDYWSSIYYQETPEKPAKELIRNLGEDGVFLVRGSQSGSKVLVVFADKMPKKFKIANENGKFFVKRDQEFDSIEDLIYYYHSNELVAGVRLTIVYWQHPKYKE